MSKITASARNENCTVRVPGYCNGRNDTTVLAHISGLRFGHGVGIKVSDIFAAYACSDCHDCIDGRVKTNYTRDELKLMHFEGMAETQLKLLEKGLSK